MHNRSLEGSWRGHIAQLAEHLTVDQIVTGSIPVVPPSSFETRMLRQTGSFFCKKSINQYSLLHLNRPDHEIGPIPKTFYLQSITKLIVENIICPAIRCDVAIAPI